MACGHEGPIVAGFLVNLESEVNDLVHRPGVLQAEFGAYSNHSYMLPMALTSESIEGSLNAFSQLLIFRSSTSTGCVAISQKIVCSNRQFQQNTAKYPLSYSWTRTV